MPTYVYRCSKCEAEVELVQKMSEKAAPVCTNPDCPAPVEMESIITAGSAFILKGNGWARDGYTYNSHTGNHQKKK